MTSPPRRMMPREAALLQAARTAAGTASPMAQGQAISTTESETITAWTDSPPNNGILCDTDYNRQQDNRRDEPSGNPVGQTLQRRLAGLGHAHKCCYPHQVTVPYRPQRLGNDRRGNIDTAGADIAARQCQNRQTFTGHQRLVDFGLTLHHQAVYRKTLTLANEQRIARPDLFQQGHPGGLVASTSVARWTMAAYSDSMPDMAVRRTESSRSRPSSTKVTIMAALSK